MAQWDRSTFSPARPTSRLFVFTEFYVDLPFGPRPPLIGVTRRHLSPIMLQSAARPRRKSQGCALSCCSFFAASAHPRCVAILVIACPSGHDRQRTAMCADGGRARELTRNSQPSYGAGLEAGALGTLRSRRFFAAGTSRSPFRAIPVDGSPPDPVAIDISSPKMMMENRAAQQAPKIRIIMAYFPHTLIN